MPTYRRLRPICRHGDISHTLAPGQGDRHSAFGASEAEERSRLDGINMRRLLGIDEQHQRGHALDAKVYPKVDRVDMQGERWPAGSQPHRHGPVYSGPAPLRQGAADESLELGVVGRESGVQDAAPVYQDVAVPQYAQAAGIGLDNRSVAVEVEHTDHGVIEQVGQRGAERLGSGERVRRTRTNWRI